MSKHKFEEHHVTDSCQQERDLYKVLEGKYNPVPEKVLIDGFHRIRCQIPDCNLFFTASKPWHYYLHCEYHDRLISRNQQFKPNFPCLDCPLTFPQYHELELHVDEQHSRFSYKCPIHGCTYHSTEFKKRQTHFNMVHRLSLYQNVVHTCEVN